LPDEYIVQKFYENCGAPAHNKYNNTFQGSCAVCREGKSWLKKRRCYYIPKNNNIFCHNCGWSGTPLRWIQEVCRVTIREIEQEIKHMDVFDASAVTQPVQPVIDIPTLPHDCINLYDAMQVKFHHNELVIQRALEFVHARKLDVAINKPDALYVSLTDKVHRNRLIIPFIDTQNNITHYQSRTILKGDESVRPRYMSKQGSKKTLFNCNNISSDLDTIFVFEGPLNACFCKNGVAVAGIQDDSRNTFTPQQQAQLQQFPFHNIVWVLDSQWLDQAALNKSKILASQGERVFVWPEKFGKRYKDFNDVAIACNLAQISPQFILDNTFQGLSAELRLRSMR